MVKDLGEAFLRLLPNYSSSVILPLLPLGMWTYLPTFLNLFNPCHYDTENKESTHLLPLQSPSDISRLLHAKCVNCKVKNTQSPPLSQQNKNHYFATVSKNKEPLPHLQSFKKLYQEFCVNLFNLFYKVCFLCDCKKLNTDHR